MQPTDLLAHLNTSDLALEATPLMLWELGAATGMDEVARFMYRGGPLPPQASAKRPKEDLLYLLTDERPERKYWEMVKAELTTFLCTNDKKYRELWSRINALEGKGTSAIVLVVSGYLGERFGLQASLLAGFVAVFFYGVIKVGKEAYCRLALPGDA